MEIRGFIASTAGFQLCIRPKANIPWFIAMEITLIRQGGSKSEHQVFMFMKITVEAWSRLLEQNSEDKSHHY